MRSRGEEVDMHRRLFVSLLAIGGTSGLRNECELSDCSGQRDPQGLDPWLEINAANLRWNLKQIQSRIGHKPIMAVIKANAYGHGLTGTARLVEGARIQHFMVGKLEEACELRSKGVRGRILNFGPFSEKQADNIASLDISQNVYTDHVDSLDRAAKRAGRRAFVHVKIDTGLGRFGVPHEQALRFLERVHRLQNVAIEGVFTTLTEDPDYDQVQLRRFHAICRHAADAGIAVGLRHAASSGAICDTPNAFETLDMVRPGTMLYGLYPSLKAERERKLDLKPILTLKARVAYVKTIGPGDCISYRRAYKATRNERVATLAVGYADGFPHALAGKGQVLIAGRRCPVLTVTSNAAVVQLKDTPASLGDEAVLIGKQGSEDITVSEVAQLTGSSVYAIVMQLSGALPRIFA